MKKFGQTLLAGIVLSGGLLFGTSDAFAYSSKGNVDFHTDSNSYRGSAVIVVKGWAPSGGASVELVPKGSNRAIRDQDVGAGSFTVSWPARGIPSGLYDVHVGSQYAGTYYHGELTNYIQIN
ncbi:TPA: hypothetical protein QCY30_005979 [Bacillus toyonensis]|nr:hypothetical protein [Bacillus toyonensis]